MGRPRFPVKGVRLAPGARAVDDGQRRLTFAALDERVNRTAHALAGYTQAKQIHFVRVEDLPRSTTGKIQRHEIEGSLERGQIPRE